MKTNSDSDTESLKQNMTMKDNMGKDGRLMPGCRYLNVEFKRGDEFLDPTLVVSGPMLGCSFRF
ncbi:MAG: hypothetical protein ACI87W_001123 [Halieaceae bacterium]|jgi:hypothetical protein